MKRLLTALVVILMISVHPSFAQESACTLAPRLTVGHEGRVLQDISVNVRENPGISGTNIGRLPAAGMFSVLDGPQCVDGYQWWQVDYHYALDPLIGWIAEGDAAASEYWLEPRGERFVVTDEDGDEHYYVELEDGITEPEGCLAPPDDYTQVTFGYITVNQRTLFMIDHADQLFAAQGGLIDFRAAMTQGSYSNAVDASFGTHDGGGAVDISVRSPLDWSVRDDTEQMIDVLRVAGFAAWVREEGIFYADSPIHIHAIAVGDAELSETARRQIDGEEGYLLGLDGLPEEYDGPNPDPHGGPIVCQWMIEQGFEDMRDDSDSESQ